MTELTQLEIMNQALDKMPDQFSSKLFCKVARLLGIHEETIQGNHALRFLKRRAEQGETQSTWVKKQPKQNPTQPQRLDLFPTQVNPDDFEKECIDYLKSRGYKIFLETKQFQEV